jgi:hypothetical protein
MTISERSAWVQLFVMPTVAVVYFTIIATRAADTPLAEVSWVAPMAWAIGFVVAGVIVGTIVTAIGSYVGAAARGEEPELEDGDVRDKEIERFGDLKGRVFTGIGTFAATILAMSRVDYFWIAATLFVSGILAATYSAAMKLRAYRRGF